MNGRTIAITIAAVAVTIVAGCSQQGPDVIDPKSLLRTQSALLAIDQGSGGELLRFSEQNGVVSSSEYATANAGTTIGKIDAIYDQNDRLYLHQRDSGSIAVLDMNTRKQVASITGFPTGSAGALCGMAFSNLSQAWVVCYNSPNLYLVDAVNRVIADTISLPGNPTSVGTSGTLVMVGMQMPDGSGAVAILHSNSGTLAIEKTIPYPSPIISISASSDGAQSFFLSSGGPADDAHPHFYYLDNGRLEGVGDNELDSPPLTMYIGQEPTYTATTRNDYVYIALPQVVVQVDTHNQVVGEWYPGNYSLVGADYATDLVYISDGTTMKRKLVDGTELDDVQLPMHARAIHFVSTSKLR